MNGCTFWVEELLRIHSCGVRSSWRALTFEREGTSRRPKTWLCPAALAQDMTVGEVYCFLARGRYILSVESQDWPVGLLPLSRLYMLLSAARKPYPPLVRAVLAADAYLQSPDGEAEAETADLLSRLENPPSRMALARYAARHFQKIRAGLPHCRFAWPPTESQWEDCTHAD